VCRWIRMEIFNVISVAVGTFFQLSNLWSHECKIGTHDGKTDFYDCRECEDKLNSKLQIKDHLRHEHNIQFTKTVTVYDVGIWWWLYTSSL